jgi:hypothetical protein
MDGTIGAKALGALRVAMEALVRSEAQLNAWDAEVCAREHGAVPLADGVPTCVLIG